PACDRSGLYTATAAQMDGFAHGAINGTNGRSQPLIFTIAAGNERGIRNPANTPLCGDYVSLDSPAAAKDPIIVGSTHSDTATVTDSSSWGPTQDGRLKPDIVAPGCNTDGAKRITSTAVGGGYTPMCGTSMATPLVAAVNAL